MTLRLILMRHAKSDWDDPALDDHERPLNARGRKSALALGAWLAGAGIWPEQVLCSSARRTRETWDLVARGARADAELQILPDLYHARAQRMLDILRSHGQGGTVLMIGHNPGIATMAAMLADEPPDDPDFGRYPTGFTCVMQPNVPRWADVDWATCKIAATMAPRRLLQQDS